MPRNFEADRMCRTACRPCPCPLEALRLSVGAEGCGLTRMVRSKASARPPVWVLVSQLPRTKAALPVSHGVCFLRATAEDTITFGTIDNGKLLLFETSKNQKIGEGRDSAYRCKELETGEEFALKMYTMGNLRQRRSILHDLYAHRLQVGKHPRIVSYERVIESETTIFVLMELLAGMGNNSLECCFCLCFVLGCFKRTGFEVAHLSAIGRQRPLRHYMCAEVDRRPSTPSVSGPCARTSAFARPRGHTL